MNKIGALTIGQSPRPDMMEDIRCILPASLKIVEAGALDGLTDDEICRLAPKQGDNVLITKLNSGKTVEVSEANIVPLLNKKLAELESSGVDNTLLLCTDRFQGLSHSRPLLEPGPLISSVVPLCSNHSNIGVLVPEDSQIEQSKKDWEPFIKEVHVLSASPYDDISNIKTAAEMLASEGVDLIVLDCMGYTQAIKNEVCQAAGIPVILPKMLLARVSAELLSAQIEPTVLRIIVPITGQEAVLTQKFNDISEYLKPYLDPATVLRFSSLDHGFGSIETELQGLVNGAQVVMAVSNESDGLGQKDDGIFIDCFDDPGVYGCRELGLVPVIGPYQAAITTAMNLSDRIGVITTDTPGILNEEKKARAMGVAGRIVSIRAVELPVADIRTEKEKVLNDLIDVCTIMYREDRVTAVCLGCTAMFYIADELKERLKAAGIGINVIEPILNGMLTLEHMVKMKSNNYIPGGVNFDSIKWDQIESL